MSDVASQVAEDHAKPMSWWCGECAASCLVTWQLDSSRTSASPSFQGQPFLCRSSLQLRLDFLQRPAPRFDSVIPSPSRRFISLRYLGPDLIRQLAFFWFAAKVKAVPPSIPLGALSAWIQTRRPYPSLVTIDFDDTRSDCWLRRYFNWRAYVVPSAHAA